MVNGILWTINGNINFKAIHNMISKHVKQSLRRIPKPLIVYSAAKYSQPHHQKDNGKYKKSGIPMFVQW